MGTILDKAYEEEDERLAQIKQNNYSLNSKIMELNKTQAKRIYHEAPDWFKTQLEEEFGEESFIPNEFESIKTLEDAYAKTGESISDEIRALLTPDEIAYKELKIIVKAINMENDKVWVADWSNTNQRKWWPWFNLSSGFGFSHSGYYYGHTSTTVGSRLCFSSEERSNYAAVQFGDKYEQLLTISK